MFGKSFTRETRGKAEQNATVAKPSAERLAIAFLKSRFHVLTKQKKTIPSHTTPVLRRISR